MFTAVAVLAARKQISGWSLGAPLTALCLWSAFFAWRIRRSGLTTSVVLADAAVISALALAQQHLVQAVLIKDSTTWMLPLACTSVYILQIALRPWLGLPAAAIVVIAYGLGAGHLADAWLLVVETIVAAGLVALIRGGARQADAIVAAALETERQVRAEEARHADEREQHRQLHDTVLSTLTMVTAGAFAEPSAALTAQAARDLRMLQGLAGAPVAPGRAGAADRPETEAGAGRRQHRFPGRAAEARRGHAAVFGRGSARRLRRRGVAQRRAARWNRPGGSDRHRRRGLGGRQDH